MAPHRLPAIADGAASEVPPPDFWSRPIANFQTLEQVCEERETKRRDGGGDGGDLQWGCPWRRLEPIRKGAHLSRVLTLNLANPSAWWLPTGLACFARQAQRAFDHPHLLHSFFHKMDEMLNLIESNSGTSDFDTNLARQMVKLAPLLSFLFLCLFLSRARGSCSAILVGLGGSKSPCNTWRWSGVGEGQCLQFS